MTLAGKDVDFKGPGVGLPRRRGLLLLGFSFFVSSLVAHRKDSDPGVGAGKLRHNVVGYVVQPHDAPAADGGSAHSTPTG